MCVYVWVHIHTLVHSPLLYSPGSWEKVKKVTFPSRPPLLVSVLQPRSCFPFCCPSTELEVIKQFSLLLKTTTESHGWLAFCLPVKKHNDLVCTHLMQQYSKDCLLTFSELENQTDWGLRFCGSWSCAFPAPTEVAVGGGDSGSKGSAIVEGVEGGACLFLPLSSKHKQGYFWEYQGVSSLCLWLTRSEKAAGTQDRSKIEKACR